MKAQNNPEIMKVPTRVRILRSMGDLLEQRCVMFLTRALSYDRRKDWTRLGRGRGEEEPRFS
jgi:hypothetical protein